MNSTVYRKSTACAASGSATAVASSNPVGAAGISGSVTTAGNNASSPPPTPALTCLQNSLSCGDVAVGANQGLGMHHVEREMLPLEARPGPSGLGVNCNCKNRYNEAHDCGKC